MHTLSALSASYVEARLARGEISATTARNIESRLATLALSFGVDQPIAELDSRAVDHWQRSIGRNAPATRRSYLSTIKGFCVWLVEEGHLAGDPTMRAAKVREPRRVPRALPSATVAELLADTDARSAVILWLMVGCGLRCCEVARLEVADWDRYAETLMVHGKGGHERVLPVPSDVGGSIGRYLDGEGWAAGPLVRNNGTAVTANWLSKRVAALMAGAGVKRAAKDGISAHALRHTCASDVLDRCHDVRTVQELMGHASIATTQIYLRRANLDQLRSAMSGRTYRAA